MKLREISKSFRFAERGFEVSGLPLERIVEETGTPVFIYDQDTIVRQWNNLSQNLPGRVEIFYAMKANPNKAFVKLLTSLGSGVEVASEGELYVCENVGVRGDKIVFAGPGKTRADLEAAIKYGIYSINAESADEIHDINHVADILGKKANVSLRINPSWEVKGAKVRMGGSSKQFGIDHEQMQIAIDALLKYPSWINPVGVHIFSASNIQDQEGFVLNMENSFNVGAEANKRYPVKMIDFGGGEAIRYTDNDKELDLRGIGKKAEELIERYEFIDDNQARVIVEPGRYLVGQSGILVTSVVNIKESRGKKYVITDGGIHNLLRPALVPGAIHPIFNLSLPMSRGMMKVDVAGSLCTPIDLLGTDVMLPSKTEKKQLIGVFNAGAYGFTESMPYFLSHGIPAEVMVHDGRYTIIRDRVDAKDFLKGQRFPE